MVKSKRTNRNLFRYIYFKVINMSDKLVSSLLTLPVHLIYHILDNLDELSILFSMRNVCQRMNIIVDSYYRYQVKFHVY